MARAYDPGTTPAGRGARRNIRPRHRLRARVVTRTKPRTPGRMCRVDVGPTWEMAHGTAVPTTSDRRDASGAVRAGPAAGDRFRARRPDRGRCRRHGLRWRRHARIVLRRAGKVG